MPNAANHYDTPPTDPRASVEPDLDLDLDLDHDLDLDLVPRASLARSYV